MNYPSKVCPPCYRRTRPQSQQRPRPGAYYCPVCRKLWRITEPMDEPIEPPSPGKRAVAKTEFTTTEIVAEFRRRTEHSPTFGGSVTLRNMLRAAADLIERAYEG